MNNLLKLDVVHPGRQHSHRLAGALDRAGMLHGYYSGLPVSRRHLWWLPYKLKKNYMITEEHPGFFEKIKCLPIEPVLRRAGWFSPESFSLLGEILFDWYTSKIIQWNEIGGIAGYENASYYCFKEAKKRGKKTVLDTASVHFKYQQKKIKSRVWEWLLKWVNSRKCSEIEMADAVINVSSFARQTYVEAAGNPDKFTAVPLGFNFAQFQTTENRERRSDNFRFVFCGNISQVKGIDILLDAFAQLRSNHPDIKLLIIGAGGDLDHLRKRQFDGVEFCGRLNLAQIKQRYNECDCFVLPSRFDGFPFAVLEAMSSGLPVIISSAVGSKEIFKHGTEGFVFNADEGTAELKEKMSWALNHPAELKAIAARGFNAVRKYTWEKYDDEICAFFRKL